MNKFLVLILLFFSSVALACDPGQGTGQCGYYDNGIYYNRPLGYYSDETPQPPKTVNIRLKSRYAAIALTTNGNGHFGFISNMPSERKARREALSLCKQHGGVNCRIVSTFRNACVSISEGFSNQEKTLTQLRLGFSAYRNESDNLALNECRKAGLLDCKVIDREQCSLPVLP